MGLSGKAGIQPSPIPRIAEVLGTAIFFSGKIVVLTIRGVKKCKKKLSD
jgi:hypothetical protein